MAAKSARAPCRGPPAAQSARVPHRSSRITVAYELSYRSLRSSEFITPQPHLAAGRGGQTPESRAIFLFQQILNFAKAGAIFPKSQLPPDQALSDPDFLKLVPLILRDIPDEFTVRIG